MSLFRVIKAPSNIIQFYDCGLERMIALAIQKMLKLLVMLENIEKRNLRYEAKKHHTQARIYLTAAALELEKMILIKTKKA